MGKQASPRKVGDNEALAVGTQIRGSAQKLNLVAGLIRGKKAEDALNILAFSHEGDGGRRPQGARLGDRQCREQPQSRRRRARRRRGVGRQVASR